MRIVHLSDLHLGFSRYPNRMDHDGVNQRTADVHATFVRAVDMIVAEKPNLILVAGDIFDKPWPTYAASTLACVQFRRMLAVAPVVCCSGNHDSKAKAFYSRTTADGSPLALLRLHGAMVAITRAERFTVGDVSVLAVPECAAIGAEYEPDYVAAKYNVLLLHAAITGTMHGYGAVDVAAINASHFDYVALGDYHQHHAVAPNAYYSGSLDYVSTSVWRESASGIPKGFVIHNLETGANEFREVPGVRPHIDLPAIHAHGMAPADVDAAIQERVAAIEGGIDGKVVRLVVHGIERATSGALDLRALGKLRGAALHFQLDPRRPETIRVGLDGMSPLPAEPEWRYIDPSYSYLQDDDGMGPRDEESFRELNADAGEVCGIDAPYCDDDASRVPLGNDSYELEEVK